MTILKYLCFTILILILAILFANSVGAHSGTYYVAKSNGTYLRKCPESTCKKLALLPNNSLVTAQKARGSWEYVTSDAGNGWVQFAVLRKYFGGGSGAYCVDNTWGQNICAPTWIGDAIVAGADTYGVSRTYMLQLAACESNFNPSEVSYSGAQGIFQFKPGTFYWQAPNGNIGSVVDQSNTAAKMIANGLASHWECAARL